MTLTPGLLCTVSDKRLTPKKACQLAEVLFMDGGYTNTEIAELVGREPSQITVWDKRHGWSKQRDILHSNTQALQEVEEERQWLKDYHKGLDDEKRYANMGRFADAMNKLLSTIDRLKTETTQRQAGTVLLAFMKQLAKDDRELAELVEPHIMQAIDSYAD